jgi:hypothetical protein
MTWRELIHGCSLLVLATGCAAQRAQLEASMPMRDSVADRAVTASALLFDPPVYADDLPPDLAREGREMSAFVAYEDQTTTFSYVHIDDHQLFPSRHSRDRFERRAIIDRFGSSTR